MYLIIHIKPINTHTYMPYAQWDAILIIRDQASTQDNTGTRTKVQIV